MLTDAVQRARIGSTDLDGVVFDFLLALFTKAELNETEARFIAEWQQFAPAVMAKGMEDTTFYNFDRLVSCNEVGAQASLIGISADKFHEFCHHLSDCWPNTLLATSTHDNKRSEDVRTRISVLSDIPDRWSEALQLWSHLNAAAWNHRTPDRHAEYLFYQTLIGAWPISPERSWQYMLKACREAKSRTSWHEPNLGYEENIRGFVESSLANGALISSLEAFIEPLVLPGHINSLSQTLLKMLVPGVPDFYQGTELWDRSLVDPDNRRPVDFVQRRELLERCKTLTAAEALRDWQSGLPKLWMTYRLLSLRRERSEDFGMESKYQPLVAQGTHLGNLFAFRRGPWLIAVVPRFTLSLNGDWGDTTLPLPQGTWRNLFDGSTVQGAAGVDATARPDDRYRFSVDGCYPLPDPRSLWQPDGVHGDSRVVDRSELHRLHHDAYSPKPLREAVIYEMHIGTFTPEGTYQAAQTRLAHLADLGITHVELMPLATFPGRHGWGYDGVYHYAPMPTYGTPHDLARFVAACHRHGLAVLLDVVYNHFWPDGNYVTAFGPYLTDRVKTPWGDAINYDGPSSDGVRSFFIDNALMWLADYGFDGLRLDAVHAIHAFEAVHFLEDLASAVRHLGEELDRDFLLIAESDLNDPRLVRAPQQGGYGQSAHWADDFHHAVHGYFTKDATGYYVDFHGLEDVATALRAGYVYQGQFSRHRQRRHGRSPTGVRSRQLVVCSQNHDQIGNRAQGERLGMLLERHQIKAIAALVLLSPFVPLIFQGEEWGAGTPFIYFTDHENEELGRRVTEGRAREFRAFDWHGEVPNPQASESFTRSKLDWRELREAGHRELFDWYRRLIALRHDALGAFDHTRATMECDAAADWLTFTVADLLVAFNLAAWRQCVPMAAGDWSLIMSSAAHDDIASPEFPGGVHENIQAAAARRRRASSIIRQNREARRVERHAGLDLGQFIGAGFRLQVDEIRVDRVGIGR